LPTKGGFSSSENFLLPLNSRDVVERKIGFLNFFNENSGYYDLSPIASSPTPVCPIKIIG